MSPITLDRRSSFTLPVSWLPICGTWLATAWMTLSRNDASTDAARPSTVTRTSSSGNSAMKLEYARLATSTPPLSSPYFLTTPNTKAVGVKRCWIASILTPSSWPPDPGQVRLPRIMLPAAVHDRAPGVGSRRPRRSRPM